MSEAALAPNYRGSEALADRDLGKPALAYLAGLSRGSRRAQATALGKIADRLGGFDVVTCPWHKLEHVATQAIRAWLVESYAPATVNRHLAALRGVLRSAWRAGIMDNERYQRAVDLPNVRASRVPAGRQASQEDLQRLFETCDRSHAGARDRALLAILTGVGLRRAEAAGLDLADVDLGTGEIRVSGKGDRERIAWAGDDVILELRRWIRERGHKPGSLFGLTDSGIYQMVTVRARRAGVPHLSPHDLRRTLVSDLLDAGADLVAVRDLVGHASVETTARYDRRGERAKRAAANLVRLPKGD